jgi:hypothetical protein
MTEWDEILKKLNGFDLPDATLQADHIVSQMLDGLRVGSHNRDTVREYLIMHLLSAEKRGAKAAIEEKFRNYGCD